MGGSSMENIRAIDAVRNIDTNAGIAPQTQLAILGFYSMRSLWLGE